MVPSSVLAAAEKRLPWLVILFFVLMVGALILLAFSVGAFTGHSDPAHLTAGYNFLKACCGVTFVPLAAVGTWMVHTNVLINRDYLYRANAQLAAS